MDSSLILFLVVVAISCWVFLDAATHKIGVIHIDKQSRGASPLLWGIMTFCLLIVVLPYYLIRRRRLIELAKEHPVETRPHNVIILLVLAAVYLVYAYQA